MKLSFTSVVVLLLPTFMISLQVAQAVTLVEDGKASATIVLGDQPSASARAAASMLQAHLREISGADVAIVGEGQLAAPAKAGPMVLVGESGLAKSLGITAEDFRAGEFRAMAKGNVLALVGSENATPTDQFGSLYATTWFLENKLGVRYLWPGELGKVVPQQRSIQIADFEHRSAPALAQRQIRSMGYHDRVQVGLDRLGFTKDDYERLRNEASTVRAETCDWFRWQGMGGTLNIQGGHAFDHLWDKYGKEHPDWFALQPNGSRDMTPFGARPRLCKSNAGLIAAIAAEKIEELNKNPHVLGVSLAPNDGGRATFCTCPQCEALDAPSARKIMLWDFTGKERREFEHVALTDRMVYFWNSIAEEVVKTHPGKLFTVDAYSAYEAAPVERKLHPNLVVRFAALSYEDETVRRQAIADWDAWASAARRIYFRSNLMLAGRRTGMPLVYVHRFAEDFRHFAAHEMMGTDLDSCTHNWATQGLNYYVAARLHWDPSQDVDALIDDYCRAGFGPAAKSLRAYFDKLESVYSGTASRHEDSFSGFSDAVLVDLDKHMTQAEAEAAADPMALRRVRFVRAGLRWTGIEVRAHRLLVDPAKVAPAMVKQVLDERFAMMRELFQKHPLAVNVAYISWGEDGLWAQIGYRPPKP